MILFQVAYKTHFEELQNNDDTTELCLMEVSPRSISTLYPKPVYCEPLYER
jgi:hypothetical protein